MKLKSILMLAVHRYKFTIPLLLLLCLLSKSVPSKPNPAVSVSLASATTKPELTSVKVEPLERSLVLKPTSRPLSVPALDSNVLRKTDNPLGAGKANELSGDAKFDWEKQGRLMVPTNPGKPLNEFSNRQDGEISKRLDESSSNGTKKGLTNIGQTVSLRSGTGDSVFYQEKGYLINKLEESKDGGSLNRSKRRSRRRRKHHRLGKRNVLAGGSEIWTDADVKIDSGDTKNNLDTEHGREQNIEDARGRVRRRSRRRRKHHRLGKRTAALSNIASQQEDGMRSDIIDLSKANAMLGVYGASQSHAKRHKTGAKDSDKEENINSLSNKISGSANFENFERNYPQHILESGALKLLSRTGAILNEKAKTGESLRRMKREVTSAAAADNIGTPEKTLVEEKDDDDDDDDDDDADGETNNVKEDLEDKSVANELESGDEEIKSLKIIDLADNVGLRHMSNRLHDIGKYPIKVPGSKESLLTQKLKLSKDQLEKSIVDMKTDEAARDAKEISGNVDIDSRWERQREKEDSWYKDQLNRIRKENYLIRKYGPEIRMEINGGQADVNDGDVIDLGDGSDDADAENIPDSAAGDEDSEAAEAVAATNTDDTDSEDSDDGDDSDDDVADTMQRLEHKVDDVQSLIRTSGLPWHQSASRKKRSIKPRKFITAWADIIRSQEEKALKSFISHLPDDSVIQTFISKYNPKVLVRGFPTKPNSLLRSTRRLGQSGSDSQLFQGLRGIAEINKAQNLITENLKLGDQEALHQLEMIQADLLQGEDNKVVDAMTYYTIRQLKSVLQGLRALRNSGSLDTGDVFAKIKSILKSGKLDGGFRLPSSYKSPMSQLLKRNFDLKGIEHWLRKNIDVHKSQKAKHLDLQPGIKTQLLQNYKNREPVFQRHADTVPPASLENFIRTALDSGLARPNAGFDLINEKLVRGDTLRNGLGNGIKASRDLNMISQTLAHLTKKADMMEQKLESTRKENIDNNVLKTIMIPDKLLKSLEKDLLRTSKDLEAIAYSSGDFKSSLNHPGVGQQEQSAIPNHGCLGKLIRLLIETTGNQRHPKSRTIRDASPKHVDDNVDGSNDQERQYLNSRMDPVEVEEYGLEKILENLQEAFPEPPVENALQRDTIHINSSAAAVAPGALKTISGRPNNKTKEDPLLKLSYVVNMLVHGARKRRHAARRTEGKPKDRNSSLQPKHRSKQRGHHSVSPEKRIPSKESKIEESKVGESDSKKSRHEPKGQVSEKSLKKKQPASRVTVASGGSSAKPMSSDDEMSQSWLYAYHPSLLLKRSSGRQEQQDQHQQQEQQQQLERELQELNRQEQEMDQREKALEQQEQGMDLQEKDMDLQEQDLEQQEREQQDGDKDDDSSVEFDDILDDNDDVEGFELQDGDEELYVDGDFKDETDDGEDVSANVEITEAGDEKKRRRKK